MNSKNQITIAIDSDFANLHEIDVNGEAFEQIAASIRDSISKAQMRILVSMNQSMFHNSFNSLVHAYFLNTKLDQEESQPIQTDIL